MEGNWQPGPIATLIDMAAAAAIMSCEDTIKVTVDLDISFFSPAKIGVCISHPAVYITWDINQFCMVWSRTAGVTFCFLGNCWGWNLDELHRWKCHFHIWLRSNAIYLFFYMPNHGSNCFRRKVKCNLPTLASILEHIKLREFVHKSTCQLRWVIIIFFSISFDRETWSAKQ